MLIAADEIVKIRVVPEANGKIKITFIANCQDSPLIPSILFTVPSSLLIAITITMILSMTLVDRKSVV